jgi:hypothetical protein
MQQPPENIKYGTVSQVVLRVWKVVFHQKQETLQGTKQDLIKLMP